MAKAIQSNELQIRSFNIQETNERAKRRKRTVAYLTCRQF
jgi:hypothetical protein